jgi:hypothetical protein
MNKHAAQSSLEKRVVTVLAGNGNLPSAAELQDLIRDTEAEQTRSLEVAENERTRSLDLVSCPDPSEAHERITAAKLTADRLSVCLPKLRDKLSEALTAEAKDRWWNDCKRVKTQLDEAVVRFQEYQSHAQAIADLLAEAAEVDKAVSDLNGRAPNSIDRRLRSVELTARTMTGFTRDNPSLAATVVLPRWDASARNLWPARPSTSLAAEFAGSMVPAPHPGARWGESEERERRRAAAEKENAQMATYHETAQASENERNNRQEVERFRQAHPRQ